MSTVLKWGLSALLNPTEQTLSNSVTTLADSSTWTSFELESAAAVASSTTSTSGKTGFSEDRLLGLAQSCLSKCCKARTGQRGRVLTGTTRKAARKGTVKAKIRKKWKRFGHATKIQNTG